MFIYWPRDYGKMQEKLYDFFTIALIGGDLVTFRRLDGSQSGYGYIRREINFLPLLIIIKLFLSTDPILTKLFLLVSG